MSHVLQKELTLSAGKLAILVGTVAVTGTVGGMVSMLFSAIGTLPGDHFRVSNLVERVGAVESAKVDRSVYEANFKTLTDNQNEMRTDIKELLKRREVYNK